MSDDVKQVGEDSDMVQRRGRYRCSKEEDYGRCEERYRNSSYSKEHNLLLKPFILPNLSYKFVPLISVKEPVDNVC